MQCQRCGKELGGDTRCSFCGYDNAEGSVREMSSIEKNFYNGVTIDAGTGEENSYGNGTRSSSSDRRRYSSYSRSTIYTSSDTGIFSRLFSKFISGILGGNIIARAAAALIVLALSALIFFVALPIMFVLLALGIALFTFSRIGR